MQKILIVYWTMTGNTEAMANAIAAGCEGNEVDCVRVDARPSLEGYDKVILGCPATGSEQLDESEFEPYFSSIEKTLDGKKVGLFGSNDWGDGQWMREWEERVKAAGAQLFDSGLISQLTPDDESLEACTVFGKSIADF